MLRLTANKTKLYTLVAHFVDNLPPMRSGTEFIKYPRSPDYALNWITPEWDTAHAFFSTCMDRPLLSIEIKDGETGKTVSRTTHALDLQDLRERGMVEEFTTAAERRRKKGRSNKWRSGKDCWRSRERPKPWRPQNRRAMWRTKENR